MFSKYNKQELSEIRFCLNHFMTSGECAVLPDEGGQPPPPQTASGPCEEERALSGGTTEKWTDNLPEEE